MFIYGASRNTLHKEAAGRPARSYLMGPKRGLDFETISKFRMGYVPPHINHAFAGRIVMPIFDVYGELLALSVRAIEDGVDPKYWNESFCKSEHLYGFYQARHEAIKHGFVVLVEGQMDVSSMHAYGITNTVGLLGGAFTPLHTLLLKKFGINKIAVMMDGDKSGASHTAKIIETLQFYNFGKDRKTTALEYCVVKLPEGLDPNKVVLRFGGLEVRRRIADAMEASEIRLPEGWRDARVA